IHTHTCGLVVNHSLTILKTRVRAPALTQRTQTCMMRHAWRAAELASGREVNTTIGLLFLHSRDRRYIRSVSDTLTKGRWFKFVGLFGLLLQTQPELVLLGFPVGQTDRWTQLSLVKVNSGLNEEMCAIRANSKTLTKLDKRHILGSMSTICFTSTVEESTCLKEPKQRSGVPLKPLQDLLDGSRRVLPRQAWNGLQQTPLALGWIHKRLGKTDERMKGTLNITDTHADAEQLDHEREGPDERRALARCDTPLASLSLTHKNGKTGEEREEGEEEEENTTPLLNGSTGAMAKEDEKKESGQWKDFFWNPRTHELLGRTAGSWGERPSPFTSLSCVRVRLGAAGVLSAVIPVTGAVLRNASKGHHRLVSDASAGDGAARSHECVLKDRVMLLLRARPSFRGERVQSDQSDSAARARLRPPPVPHRHTCDRITFIDHR
ncbi:hypothetical protein DNTS_027667, partial [Danionella cerebrum]